MKITCPSCTSEYNVPGVLAEGRVVRCAKCGTEWAPVPAVLVEAEAAPPPPPPQPEPPPLPIPEPPERLAPPPPVPPARPLPLLFAWLGSGVVILAAVVAAFVFREPIMHGWPPSQRVYGALGLHEAASPDIHGDVVK